MRHICIKYLNILNLKIPSLNRQKEWKWWTISAIKLQKNSYLNQRYKLRFQGLLALLGNHASRRTCVNDLSTSKWNPVTYSSRDVGKYTKKIWKLCCQKKWALHILAIWPSRPEILKWSDIPAKSATQFRRNNLLSCTFQLKFEINWVA